ncbi:MAG: 5-formyltetrahydrofolate cyclo-ligase [Bacteroidaceae bacterium]|nr:5-formyltetrahydrofolate cyclo-ligase [Bacteroidaceae bacterium]
MEDKKSLRRQIRQMKAAMTTAEREAQSLRLCRTVLASSRWAEAGVVLLYHALPDEVDTRLLLDEGLRQGKTLLLPSVQADGSLLLRRFDGSTCGGAFGIQEAQGSLFDNLEAIDLVIVPGMAFDPQGHRLGRGGGYYDRLLCHMPAYRIGVCFPWQLVSEVPCEPHDMVMDEVVS